MTKPAPSARKVVTMMAEYKDRSYKSLLPPIGYSPMDPKLPKMIDEWQQNMKDWNEGKYEGKDNSKTVKEYEKIRMPLAVDCPNCGEHIELFVEKGKASVNSHHDKSHHHDTTSH